MRDEIDDALYRYPMLSKPTSDTTRKWSDYGLITSPYDGSRFIKQYIERFGTVSFFNEFAGLLSYFFILGQALAPYMRIPIRGSHIDCRVHVYWLQAARSGKSVAYEFMSKIISFLGIEKEQFSAGSDARLIGTVEPKVVYDDNGKPTKEVEYEVIPGLLNGYKTLLFDEASILLTDSKSYFSDKILYLQQSMAPIGSETNVLAKHLVGGSIYTPSGVSLWMTTFPPPDIMTHVLEKGFFQRVFLFQRDVSPETRQTTSEHRLSGAYVPVPDQVWSYESIADSIREIQEEVRDRLFSVAGVTQEEWDELKDAEREELAIKHAYGLFSVGPSYHAALLNAVDEYYDLINTIQNERIKETAMSFMPNVENYTMIFANLIAATMRSSVVTSDHVVMATEIIYDNLHHTILWLEDKQDYKISKKREADHRAWRTAYNRCAKVVHDRTKKEVVRKSELERIYSALNGISTKTARRRLDIMLDAKIAIRIAEGRNAFIALEL